MKKVRICRHCKESVANRPRSLCWTCYNTDGVRELYPTLSKFGYRGVGCGNKNGKLAKRPTKQKCGSKQKIRLMSERAKRGESLFHPDDNKVLARKPKGFIFGILLGESDRIMCKRKL